MLLLLLFESELALLGDVFLQLADGNTDLLHGVTVTDGDAVVSFGGLVADGLEVHGDAQGSTDLRAEILYRKEDRILIGQTIKKTEPSACKISGGL